MGLLTGAEDKRKEVRYDNDTLRDTKKKKKDKPRKV